MRSVLRHLSPFIRSRRRISFLFTIGTLLSIAFILFIINHNPQSEVFIDKTTKIQLISTNKINISIQKSIPAQKYEILCMNSYILCYKYLF
jgi:uncharacterized BrkB/YihY/UPF0761 family membrane protein